MSAFAIKNLMEVDDAFEGPEREVRFARKYLDSEHLGISYERLAAETVRGFDAGPEGMEMIVAGADKPEGGDGVLAKGRWADEA
jgi:hypothetical protein